MWLIIGYGNCLRGDDGVGYRLAELLRDRLPLARARVLAEHQLTPELALELAAPEIDRVLFLDARRDQREPLILSNIAPPAGDASCGHQLSPGLLLHLTTSLYNQAPSAWLLTLPASQFNLGETLSPAAAASVDVCARRIESLIADASEAFAESLDR
ncbi:MAG: hydrogenase maturation protease [Trichloromonadaceae bacterium]